VEQDYLIDDGLVDRLLAALADALRRTRKDPFGSPVTVAEIYQDLVPYRSVRTALGFQMNADYEHTVLRLLAGENELAKLEPDEAREELRSELDTPNPNVGLFRKFAACDVWILRTELTLGDATDTTGKPERMAPAPIHEPSLSHEPDPPGHEPAAPMSDLETTPAWQAEHHAPDPVTQPAVEPASPVDASEDDLPVLELETELVGEEAGGEGPVDGGNLEWAESVPEGEWSDAEGELLLEEEVQDPPDTPDTSVRPAAAGAHEPMPQPEAAVMFDSSQSQGTIATAHAAGSCSFCQGSLPGGRVVRFCPSCGADQSMQPCGSCREPLDPSWKFCIGCGQSQN
jgi:hypothetical protein